MKYNEKSLACLETGLKEGVAAPLMGSTKIMLMIRQFGLDMTPSAQQFCLRHQEIDECSNPRRNKALIEITNPHGNFWRLVAA